MLVGFDRAMEVIRLKIRYVDLNMFAMVLVKVLVFLYVNVTNSVYILD